MQLWQTSIGYMNEESVEAWNQINNNVRRRYLNQREILRIKYMMIHLMILTSPEYAK